MSSVGVDSEKRMGFIRPVIDFRMFFTTGTAHFDGLVVEEL